MAPIGARIIGKSQLAATIAVKASLADDAASPKPLRKYRLFRFAKLVIA
jgi:hypothetical protein